MTQAGVQTADGSSGGSTPAFSGRAYHLFDADTDDNRSIIIAIILALVLHGVFGLSATQVKIPKKAERITVTMVQPKPPPPPTPPPEEPKPEPPKPEKLPPPPKDIPPPPPPSNQTPPPELPPEPVPVVTGISMESTVAASGGPAVRVGNTTFGDPDKEKFTKPSDVKAYAGGQPGFKAEKASGVSQEPRLVADCRGRYPPELADQGIEGAVVMNIDVDKTGAIAGVRLAKTSGNTVLDKLAQQYIKRCKFAPAMASGVAVDYTLRYTYSFVLDE